MKGYRKFTLAIVFVAIGLATGAAHHGEIPQGVVELLLGLFGAFAAGNLGEHYFLSKGQSAPKASPPGSGEMAQATLVPDVTLHGKTDQLLATAQVTQHALEFVVNYIKSFEAQKQHAVTDHAS